MLELTDDQSHKSPPEIRPVDRVAGYRLGIRPPQNPSLQPAHGGRDGGGYADLKRPRMYRSDFRNVAVSGELRRVPLSGKTIKPQGGDSQTAVLRIHLLVVAHQRSEDCFC